MGNGGRGARGAATPAVAQARRAGVRFALRSYDAAAASGCEDYGQAVAAQLGAAPQRVFKTLIAQVDAALTAAVVPVASRLDLKALAAAVGAKRAVMADRAAAERATGYVTGGISPLGQRRPLPVVVDASVLDHERVFCSAGRRGLQMELTPQDLIAACSARTAALAARTPGAIPEGSERRSAPEPG